MSRRAAAHHWSSVVGVVGHFAEEVFELVDAAGDCRVAVEDGLAHVAGLLGVFEVLDFLVELAQTLTPPLALRCFARRGVAAVVGEPGGGLVAGLAGLLECLGEVVGQAVAGGASVGDIVGAVGHEGALGGRGELGHRPREGFAVAAELEYHGLGGAVVVAEDGAAVG